MYTSSKSVTRPQRKGGGTRDCALLLFLSPVSLRFPSRDPTSLVLQPHLDGRREEVVVVIVLAGVVVVVEEGRRFP